MPELLLLPGEQVLFVTRRHPLVLLVPLALLLTANILIASDFCPLAVALHLDGRCPLVSALTLTIAAAPFLLEYLTTRLVLTTFRLILVRAPVGLRTRSLELTGTLSVTVRQGFFGRLLGYGDLVADSAATEGNRIVFPTAPQPQALAARIEAARQTLASVPGGSGAP